MLPSLPSLLPEQPPARPKDVRLKRASLAPVSPTPGPKLPLAGSTGGEIGLSRSVSRTSAVSSASTSSQNLAASASAAHGMARSASQASAASAGSHSTEGEAEDTADGKSQPPTPRDMAAVLDSVMW